MRSLLRTLWNRLLKPAGKSAQNLPDGAEPLQVAVVGLGAIGRLHAQLLQDNPWFRLVATCSQSARSPDSGIRPEIPHCSSFRELLEKPEVKAVVVASPHRFHAGQILFSLQSGAHVLCEKPLALTVADADKVLQASAAAGRILAVVSQTRYEPSYQQVKQLLVGGTLGEIRRCSLVETFWRPSSYYQSAAWRGTWAGEGGGVLVNQAPHVIDRYLWLCGLPTEVTAFCDTALHPIEVEDTASLILRNENGMHGYIHVNTTELPPQSRLEVVCDRGRIVVNNGHVTVDHLSGSLRSNAVQVNSPTLTVREEQLGGQLSNWSPELLVQTHQHFARAAWGMGERGATGLSGRAVVEVMNAAQLSHWNRCVCRLPVKPTEIQKMLKAVGGV